MGTNVDKLMREITTELTDHFNLPFTYTMDNKTIQVHSHGYANLDGLDNFLSVELVEKAAKTIEGKCALLIHYIGIFKETMRIQDLGNVLDEMIINMDMIDGERITYTMNSYFVTFNKEKYQSESLEVEKEVPELLNQLFDQNGAFSYENLMEELKQKL